MMPAITRPFDENHYPTHLGLTRALLDVLALARELSNDGGYLRTRITAERLDIGKSSLLHVNAAYKRIRRLRDLGLLHTQLMWCTDNGGSHPIKVPRRDGKKGIELHPDCKSGLGLVAWPTLSEQWGKPDEVESRFDPRSRKYTWARDNRKKKARNPR